MVDTDRAPRFDPVDLDAWRSQVRQDLGGRDPEGLVWRSLDGVEIGPLYVEPGPSRGVPGAPPFVRGSEPAPKWLIAQEARGHNRDAILENAARALREGADAVWLDAEVAARAFTRASDFAPFAALPGPVFIEGGARSTALSAAWLAAPATAPVTVLADPLGTLASRGALATSLERELAHLAEVVRETAARAPEARPILVSGRPYHEGGASAVHELGIVTATGIAYLRALSDLGHPLADLPRRMLFDIALDSDFFLGIAKLRAARLLWSKVLCAVGIEGPEQGMRIRARSSRRMATVIDPQLGILRGTAAAFAGAVAGATLVTVEPYDALSDTPDPLADRLARTTQLVMRHEALLDRVLDPAGGSYFLENLTEELARRAWSVMQEIERSGGVPHALADGAIAARVRAGADARRHAAATREQAMVGVSRYPSPGDVPPTTSTTPEPPAVTVSPVRLASGPVLDALRAKLDDATLDELAAALASDDAARAVRIEPMRDAAPFEALRRRASALASDRRRADVLAVGDARTIEPRIAFVVDVLAVAGLEARIRRATTPSELLAGAQDELGRVVVPCATDEEYLDVARALVPRLRERGARFVVLATRPNDALRASGADAFVHRGADLVSALDAALTALEAE